MQFPIRNNHKYRGRFWSPFISRCRYRTALYRRVRVKNAFSPCDVWADIFRNSRIRFAFELCEIFFSRRKTFRAERESSNRAKTPDTMTNRRINQNFSGSTRFSANCVSIRPGGLACENNTLPRFFRYFSDGISPL